MSRAAKSLFLLAAVLPGACSDLYYDRRETVSLSAGDAVATNKVTQTIDVWPPEAGERRIVSNGEKMQGAIERYRTNKVTPPVGIDTSSVGYQPAGSGAGAPTTSN